MLSYLEIVSKLQIYSCCLSLKGIDAINCQKKGHIPDYTDIILMNQLINTMKSCISAQAILPAPATPTPNVPAIPRPVPPVPVSPIPEIYPTADPITIEISIRKLDGSYTYYPDLVIALSDRTETLAFYIAEFMNCISKQYGYTARVYNETYLAIFGYQYEDDNGIYIEIYAKDNSNSTKLIKTAFVGGVENCCPPITETLEKLDRLCNKPCNEIVNTF